MWIRKMNSEVRFHFRCMHRSSERGKELVEGKATESQNQLSEMCQPSLQLLILRHKNYMFVQWKIGRADKNDSQGSGFLSVFYTHFLFIPPSSSAGTDIKKNETEWPLEMERIGFFFPMAIGIHRNAMYFFFIDNQKESMYSNGQSVSFIFSVSLFNIQNLFLMQRQLCVYYRVIASTFTSNRCQIIFPEPDCFHLPPLAQLLAIANQLQAHWLLRLILIIG